MTSFHILSRKHCLGAPFCILKESLSSEHSNPQKEKKKKDACMANNTIFNEKPQANSTFYLIFESINWCLKGKQGAVKIHHTHDFMLQPQINTLHSAWDHLSGLRIHWWVWGFKAGFVRVSRSSSGGSASSEKGKNSCHCQRRCAVRGYQ